MRRFPLLLLAAVLAVPVAAVGCEKASTTTNPDLKVPEVPPGNRTQPKAK
jgi:hypothetical protein